MSKPANRRGFLAALVALPVAAKEAAGKMGMQGVLGGVWGGDSALGPYPPSAGPSSDTESFWKRQLRQFTSSRSQRRYRRITAKHEARRLDPDLAAMRSLSPSAAYAIQYGRCLERGEREGRESILDNIYDDAMEQAERGMN